MKINLVSMVFFFKKKNCTKGLFFFFLIFWKEVIIQNRINNISFIIRNIIEFRFLILWIISIFVTNLIINIFLNKFINKNYKEFPNLEIFWTFFPSLILLSIAIPSIFTLYLIERKKYQNINIKITGHQWYWNYDYFNKFNFDSYLESNSFLNYRNLETDNHFILPLRNNFLIITSEDVIHSWRIPSLIIKIDANPGRLNSIRFNSKIPGIFYGQCSEICGANHTFIPIVLEVVNFLNFKKLICKKNF